MNSLEETQIRRMKLSQHARKRRNRRLRWKKYQQNEPLSQHTQKRRNKKLKWKQEHEQKQNEISHESGILIINSSIEQNVLTNNSFIKPDIVFDSSKVYFLTDCSFFKIAKVVIFDNKRII
jgi:hypothetical protein